MHRKADYARSTARSLLAAELPDRWSHVESVGLRADGLAPHLGVEGDVLRCAAWLHDIGYSPRLSYRGFHPLDGALYLKHLDAPERVAGLVAFHSSAKYEAEVLGLHRELGEFTDEHGLVRDLLWHLDMTTGPTGAVVGFSERMAEVRDRYPAEHYVIRALDLGMPERLAAIERAESWLNSLGLNDQV